MTTPKDLIHIFRNKDVSLDTLYTLGGDGSLTSQDRASSTDDARTVVMKPDYLNLLRRDKARQSPLTLTRSQLAYRLEQASRQKETL